MILGIIGYGTVGKALTTVFEQKGYDVYVNDTRVLGKEWNYHKSVLKQNCDVIFICVPTPVKNGKMDLSIVESCLNDLDFSSDNNPLIVIKSTVLPDFTTRMQMKYPNLRIAFNPEFLRARTPVQDFEHPDRILIGTTNPEDADLLLQVYENWGITPRIVCDPTTAEAVKMLSNALLVHKVAFACEVAEICKRLDVDMSLVMDYVLMDKRFNPSHLDPSLGKIASSSPCLPKDLIALISALQKLGYDSQLLKADRKTAIGI